MKVQKNIADPCALIEIYLEVDAVLSLTTCCLQILTWARAPCHFAKNWGRRDCASVE